MQGKKRRLQLLEQKQNEVETRLTAMNQKGTIRYCRSFENTLWEEACQAISYREQGRGFNRNEEELLLLEANRLEQGISGDLAMGEGTKYLVLDAHLQVVINCKLVILNYAQDDNVCFVGSGDLPSVFPYKVGKMYLWLKAPDRLKLKLRQ